MLKVILKDGGAIYTFKDYTHWTIVGEWVEVYRDDYLIGLVKKMSVEGIIDEDRGVEVIEKS